MGFTTFRRAATEAGQTAIRIGKDPKKATLDIVEAFQQAELEWERKTPEQKLDSVADASAGTTLSAAGTLVTGGAGRLLEGSAGALDAAAKMEKLAKTA